MAVISIADVLTQVAFELHLPAFASGEFVTDAQALALAKRAVSRLGALLNRSFGDAYFARVTTLSTQADTDVISLPADFKDLLSVQWVDGDNVRILQRAEITEFDAVPRGWSLPYLPKYRIQGETLYFTPIPNGVFSVRLTYTTGLRITATSDTIQAPPGADEWLILDICAAISRREKTDGSDFIARRRDIEADLKSQAAKRDRTGATSIRDVRGELCEDETFFWRDRLGVF